MVRLRKKRILALTLSLVLTGSTIIEAVKYITKKFGKEEITDVIEDELIAETTDLINQIGIHNLLAKEEEKKLIISDLYNNCINDEEFLMMCNVFDIKELDVKNIILDEIDNIIENPSVDNIKKYIFNKETNLLNRAGEDVYNYLLNDETGRTILKYSLMYRVDPLLMYGLFKQESNLDHVGHLPGINGYSGAIGIGQHEKTTLGETYKAYNYATGEEEFITATEENLRVLDNNVKATTMKVKTYLNNYEGNIPLALISYNFGVNRGKDVAKAAANEYGITVEDLAISTEQSKVNSVLNHAKNLSENPSNYFNTSSTSYGDGEYVNRIAKRIVDNTDCTYLYGKIDKEANVVTLIDITNPQKISYIKMTYSDYVNITVEDLSYVKELAKK